jgi:hypothetical protein
LACFGGNNLPACGGCAPPGVNKKCRASKGRRHPADGLSSNSNADAPILRCTADITFAEGQGERLQDQCQMPQL